MVEMKRGHTEHPQGRPDSRLSFFYWYRRQRHVRKVVYTFFFFVLVHVWVLYIISHAARNRPFMRAQSAGKPIFHKNVTQKLITISLIQDIQNLFPISLNGFRPDGTEFLPCFLLVLLDLWRRICVLWVAPPIAPPEL